MEINTLIKIKKPKSKISNGAALFNTIKNKQ